MFGGVVHGVIAENDVTVHNTLAAGISLYGLVSGVTVRDNSIAGDGAYALRIAQGSPGDVATHNFFLENEVSDFKAGTADVFLDINSSSNIVVDSCGTSIDLGTGNVVRCGD